MKSDRKPPHPGVSPSRRAKHRLRWLIGTFFFGLSLPLYLLLHTVYGQLERESVFRYKTQAEEVVGRVEQRVTEVLAEEQQRPFAEYSFFNVLENPLLQSKGVKFSPLSEHPPRSTVPGIVGYFQIDPDGSFHTPVLPDLDGDALPAASNLSPAELSGRLAFRERLRHILANKAASPAPAEESVRAPATVSENEEGAGHRARQALRKARKPSRETSFDTLIKQDAKLESKFATIGRATKAAGKKNTQKGLSSETLNELNIDDSDWNRIGTSAAVDPVMRQFGETRKAESYYRRKEKVEIPDQTAAGALFNRDQALTYIDSADETDDAAAAVAPPQSEASPARPDSPGRQSVAPVEILSFESEIDPLQMTTLGAGHLCLYRRVWRDNGRYVQGFVVEQNAFLRSLVGGVFHGGQIGTLTRLIVAHGGRVLEEFAPAPAPLTQRTAARPESSQPEATPNVLLHRAFLSPPLEDVELLFSIDEIPYGPGRLLIDATAAALALVLGLGLFGLYRLGARQIDLLQQQRNFVSAVSHELKTPLTSIRMYGEMLREGWVHEEDRKKTYYDYIFFESERLSRLIANVLQLAKLENHGVKPDLKPCDPLELLEMARSKVLAQAEAAGLTLNLMRPEGDLCGQSVVADGDILAQIFINLVDNAIKFSPNAKTVDLGLRLEGDSQVVFFVRDYGPGIGRDQMRKIFRLFYRAGDELTRTKPGTGIGLALVTQLADQLNARIDVANRKPGAEFQVKFRAGR